MQNLDYRIAQLELSIRDPQSMIHKQSMEIAALKGESVESEEPAAEDE